jgi:hypothetical protein
MERLRYVRILTFMERVDNIRSRRQDDLARASYQDGLRRVFEACHEPMPERMAQVLHILEREESSNGRN